MTWIADYYTLVDRNGELQQITEETANQIVEAVEMNIFKGMWFTDLSGSRTWLRLEDVATVYHTSPSIRAFVRAHNQAARAEDPSWEG